MKGVQTEIVPQPAVVQEVGGERTWEADTLNEWDNSWHETTPGANRAKRWARVDGLMMSFEDAEALWSQRARREIPGAFLYDSSAILTAAILSISS